MYTHNKEIVRFYAWLHNEGKAASSHDKMIAFFKEMGIDTAQKYQDSLLIQHQVGLGLRALMALHYSEGLKNDTKAGITPSPGNISNLERLNTQEVNGTQTLYATLGDSTIVTTAGLFGIAVNVAIDDSKTTKILSQEIMYTGNNNDDGHFYLNGYDTAGNGNCALNALAQSFAVELGMTLIPSPPEERADYIAGTFIPNNNLPVLKSLLGDGPSDLKNIIMEELSLTKDPSDADLKRYIELQSQQYQHATSTPFKDNRDAQSAPEKPISPTPQ